MKIERLKVFVANASRTNFVLVKLYTDAGIDGVGEGSRHVVAHEAGA